MMRYKKAAALFITIIITFCSVNVCVAGDVHPDENYDFYDTNEIVQYLSNYNFDDFGIIGDKNLFAVFNGKNPKVNLFDDKDDYDGDGSEEDFSADEDGYERGDSENTPDGEDFFGDGGIEDGSDGDSDEGAYSDDGDIEDGSDGDSDEDGYSYDAYSDDGYFGEDDFKSYVFDDYYFDGEEWNEFDSEESEMFFIDGEELCGMSYDEYIMLSESGEYRAGGCVGLKVDAPVIMAMVLSYEHDGHRVTYCAKGICKGQRIGIMTPYELENGYLLFFVMLPDFCYHQAIGDFYNLDVNIENYNEYQTTGILGKLKISDYKVDCYGATLSDWLKQLQ